MRFAEYRKHDAISLAGLIAKREVSAKEVLETAIVRHETGDPPAVTVEPPPPPMRYGNLCCHAILFVVLSIAVKVPPKGEPIGGACVPFV